MNSSNPAFFRTFNLAAFHWISHHPRIYPRVREHMYFMTMNLDGYVVVRLNSFDYKYKQKHIFPSPDFYCEMFLKQIIPILHQVLKECGMNGFMFTFLFNGVGQSITKHVRVEI
ncbi:MAG: hypothetical protein EOO92_27705 [Pedobacter sp.]|nr:MAG: hypothetical protein EOO92_27705 [Pedobacter sp.]